jgi:peptide/nickel transport system permease protein/oligopeptide transport system permease protein
LTAPLDVTGSEATAAPDAVLQGMSGARIEGRSLGQIAWMRLKRDRVAMAAGVVVLLLVALALLAPLIVRLYGSSPTDFNSKLIDPVFSTPRGRLGGVSWDHPLGVEPVNGRDLLARILYGARISLLIALLATLLSVVIGVLLGVLAGYRGGWADTFISRTMDVFLAFPILLFAIALAGVIPDEAFGLRGNGVRVAVLVFVIGFFSWPYMGRIVRGQTLSLREREFVDAARSLGARTPYILFRELLPNLVGPILVYATLLIPTNILFEAALSFLGVGINPPTPSWGGMLNQAIDFYRVDPMFMIVPGFAIFVTVLAFNLLGDGLRDALDPRGR